MIGRVPSSHRVAAALTLASTLTLGGLLFGCDEVYADPVTAPVTSPFGGTPDAGLTSPRTLPEICHSPPRENSPCLQRGAVCESGTSPDRRCNSLFVCAADTYGNYWTEQTPPSCAVACPDPGQIVEGAPCDVGDAGGDEAELHCAMPVGTCICTTGRDGAHAHPRKWVCARPEGDCPAKRPLLGSFCSGPRSCDYGACASKRGMRMICADEVWQVEVAACD